jgi:hypothetical protein
MPAKPTVGADLLGASRLALEAVAGVTDLVEAVHMNVLNKAIGTPAIRPVAGVTSLVYRSVKGATRLVGGGLDAVLGRLAPVLGAPPEWAGRAALVAAVNGVVGDRLAASGNPLAIALRLRLAGPATGRIVLLAHGLCMNDLQWQRDGHDHGLMLARERGYTPVYLHYNSGRHISENGRELARALQAMVDAWPVPVAELVIVAHSMGGLVARSACHAAAEEGHGWIGLLKKMAFLGTPHHGAPLERGGNWVHLVTDLSAYSAPFSRLAKMRSAGITDLRHGSLLDQDWMGRDRFEHGLALPLPVRPPVPCLAIAATLGRTPGMAGTDGLVAVASAHGEHADPQRTLGFEAVTVCRTNHMQLLSAPAVSALLLGYF